MRVYLAGPIRDYSYKWRVKATKKLIKLGFTPIDPEIIENKIGVNVVPLDIATIKSCDIVLANITELSVGTSQEMVYAHQFNKVVVTVCPETLYSSWHDYHSSFICESLKEAYPIILKIRKYWSNK